MNDLVARLFCDLTAPMRFSGQLNVGLNEITTNLVPFPRLQFLMSSLSPLSQLTLQLGTMSIQCSRRLSPKISAHAGGSRKGLYLACALMLRGRVEISDVNRNIEKLRQRSRYTGTRTGLRQVFVGCQLLPNALLSLSTIVALETFGKF